MIRMILSDLDGTLLYPERKLPEPERWNRRKRSMQLPLQEQAGLLLIFS